jgi:F420-0:gamma-glutamyl ligase
LYTNGLKAVGWQIYPPTVRITMTPTPLTVEQEAEAQRLAQQIQEESREDILALARLLVSKRESEIFGATEFQARAVVHRVAAKGFAVHLREKKTATAAVASSAPTASKRRSSKATGRKRP